MLKQNIARCDHVVFCLIHDTCIIYIIYLRNLKPKNCSSFAKNQGFSYWNEYLRVRTGIYGSEREFFVQASKCNIWLHMVTYNVYQKIAYDKPLTLLKQAFVFLSPLSHPHHHHLRTVPLVGSKYSLTWTYAPCQNAKLSDEVFIASTAFSHGVGHPGT